MPIMIAGGMTAPERSANPTATIDRAASHGLTAYMDCGLSPVRPGGRQHWVEDLIARDKRGELPIRIVATVYTRSSKDDPQAVADELVDWNRLPLLRTCRSAPARCGRTARS